jgi:hypothetical protein
VLNTVISTNTSRDHNSIKQHQGSLMGNGSAYFSHDYQAARKAFLSAAQHNGAALEHHVLPAHVGPDGQALAMDAAWIGDRTADTVVVSLSGTHGAEGFCGSAAQIAWLTEQGPPTLPKGTAMLMVHAVNPFGFAMMTRNNENNVDLNRNAIDFNGVIPDNPIYDAFYTQLPGRIGYDEDLVDEYVALEEELCRVYGNWNTTDALSRGQYQFPDGPEFGGSKAEWSTLTLHEIVRRQCAQARHIVYIDWHSLIPIGDGKHIFLCFNQTDDHLFNRVASWWGAEAIDRRVVDAQWNQGIEKAEKRPSRHGLAMWGVQHALAPRQDLAGAVVEFCADADLLNSGIRAEVRASLYENWLYRMRGNDSAIGRDITARLREMASPTRASFERAAIESSAQVYASAIAGAAAWSGENIPAQPGLLVRSSNFS